MSWTDFFDKIYVINLDKRYDRLVEVREELDRWDIPFKRVAAIEDENGAEGLRLTMVDIFNEALSKNFENILVFEDDCLFLEEDVAHVMDNVVKQLPKDYLMCFLGGQSMGFSSFYSTNLLEAKAVYSTHAVAYSKKGIELIMAGCLSSPIDNFYVDSIHKVYGKTYMTYPILATQREGFSDIGKLEISWRPFIEKKYRTELQKLQAR